MTKFNVGDKVVPISKTVKGFDNLKNSTNWNKAQEVNQPFLYIQYFDGDVNAYVCNLNKAEGGGCYFNESDLIPYIKVTKNQRITALENEVAELRPLKQEVAELKLIVHELRGKKSIEPSTTNTVEDIIEFEGQQYKKVDRKGRKGDVVIFRNNNTRFFTNGEPYKVAANGRPIDNEKEAVLSLYHDGFGRTPETVDVYELIEPKPLTPNQQRAAIIEKAKKFVDEHKSKYRSEWNIVGQTVQILIYDSNGMLMMFRQAKCNPNDVFNEHIGKAIALGRALGLDVSEFEQAVQPNEVVPGHIIVWNESPDEPHEVVTKNGDWFDFIYLKDNKRYNNHEYCEIERFTTILNDTNAKYEVSSNE